MSDVMVKFWR